MKAPRLLPWNSFKHRALLPRFRDAFRGLWTAYREEPNLRFHLFAGTGMAVVAYAAGVEGWEAAYLAVTISLVLLAEMVNTAVERAVDLASSGRRHPLAAVAKEVGAGVVLFAAAHALFAAAALFLVKRSLFETLNALLSALLEHPWLALPPVAAGLLGLFGGRAPEKTDG